MKTITSWRVFKKNKTMIKGYLILKTFKKSKLQVLWIQIIFKKNATPRCCLIFNFQKRKTRTKGY
jgi:hypothetical protein